jgi:hypothetical protein
MRMAKIVVNAQALRIMIYSNLMIRCNIKFKI